MEWSETELVEHVLLDRWMKELGIEDNMEDHLLGVDFDKEMRYLEGVLANNEARDSFKNDDKNITSNQDWVMPDTGGDQLVEGPEDHDQLRVNTVAYHSLGTWFLNNWVLSTAPGRIHEVDMSPECGERPKEEAITAPCLLMFSIVGTAGCTRKRPYARRSGRWWSAPGWCPVRRTCTPWKVKRRLILKDNTGGMRLACAASSIGVRNKDNIPKEMVVVTECTVELEQQERLSLASDKDIHVTACRAQEITVVGKWCHKQEQEVNQVAMEVDILENKIVKEHIRVADKSILRGEPKKSDHNSQDKTNAGSGVVAGQEDHHPSGHARDSAVSTNDVITVAGEGELSEQQHGQEHILVVCGSGEVHHPSGHARDGALVTNDVITVAGEGDISEQQPGQEHVLGVLGAGEGHHPSGHAQDGVVVNNSVDNNAGEGRISEQQQDASGQPDDVAGEDQQCHAQVHAHHGPGVGEGEQGQLATIGDGFKTEFRKITRARKKYCGGPDGKVQVCLTDLGFKGDGDYFPNLGGGETSTLVKDKKRKVEREPKLFSKRSRLS